MQERLFQYCNEGIISGYFSHSVFRLYQGWANVLHGGPHFKKMLKPRAAHSRYKIGKFMQCVNNHIFILQTIFVFHAHAHLMLFMQL